MNELQLELKNQLEKYRLQKIEPHMEHDDETENFRMDIFNELGALGFTGMTLPEEFGGMGLSYEDFSIALCEIAKSSVSYAVTISVSSMVQAILNEFGNADQKKKYLPALTSGAEIGAFCLSESGAGSDAAALISTAKKHISSWHALELREDPAYLLLSSETAHQDLVTEKKKKRWDGELVQLANLFFTTVLYLPKIFSQVKVKGLK